MSIVLTEEELVALTGYKLATMQLDRLRKDGFYRARMGRRGVILERSHYEAVKSGLPKLIAEPPEHEYRAPAAKIHWRHRPEHQERLRLEREVDLAERARIAGIDRLCAEQAAKIKAEAERTRPERRAALVRHHAAKRRVAELKRRPPWADLKAIRAFYSDAVRLTRETGIEHHVDHIIPLQGKLVSGLHVENNLQVLPWRDNVMKRNHFEVEA